jgi:hypothetical protein
VHNGLIILFALAVYIGGSSVLMLIKKFEWAKKHWSEAKLAYLGLENSLDPLTVARWKGEELLAMTERGDQLTIFKLKIKKGGFSWLLFPVYDLTSPRAKPGTNSPGPCRKAEK